MKDTALHSSDGQAAHTGGPGEAHEACQVLHYSCPSCPGGFGLQAHRRRTGEPTLSHRGCTYRAVNKRQINTHK